MAFVEVLKLGATNLECKGFENITVSTVVKTLTVPANSVVAILMLETNPIRIRLDGIDPTAAIGLLMSASDIIELKGSQLLAKFKAIRSGGADGTLMVHYFG